VGSRSVRARANAGSAYFPVDRVLVLPLVPRHGRRGLLEGRRRRRAERRVRRDQGRPGGASGPGRDVRGRRLADDRQRRVAAHGPPHADAAAILGRHVLAARRVSLAGRDREEGVRERAPQPGGLRGRRASERRAPHAERGRRCPEGERDPRDGWRTRAIRAPAASGRRRNSPTRSAGGSCFMRGARNGTRSSRRPSA